MNLDRALKRSVKHNDSSEPLSTSNHPQHISLGIGGENIAVSYLLSQGYSIIDRNVRFKCGEIDIIASDKDEIVFVEVRTRHVSVIMPSGMTVGPSKIAKLVRSARTWAESRMYEGFYRIDLVAITVSEGKTPVIEHIKDITEAIQ